MSEIKKTTPRDPSPIEENRVSQTFANITKMTLPEVDELAKKLKVEFNIGETVATPQAAAPTEEKKEEKGSGGNVSVKIVEIKETGLNKIKIFGAIQNFINEIEGEGINIVKAKKRTEEGDRIILTSVPRDKAEAFKKQLEGKVEIEIK